ncbi:meiosis-specific transcription factor ndt80 [Mortierella alpina]|uniref:Meiosis-specific transcription factor ndt80 n=1 Tax=Mortierella alpina TaxID=64518 RepID=A0A9P6M6P6_MORAP|nr:meiosis-specific transcription factor ndt80 [Mortierella alpina]
MTFASSSSVSSSAASSPAEASATPPNALSMGLPVSGPALSPETDSSRFEPSQGLAHSMMAPAHMQPMHPLHPLQANQGFVEPEARSLANFAGLAILTPPDQHQERDPEASQYDTGHQEASNRYSLPAFPQGESRTDHYPSSAFSSPGSFQPYAPSSDGPIIHHRNSIAGSTLPNPVVRARRAGSMAMVEDGPFFSNTKQFHRVFNMNQTQQYKLRVMARIDRGFFTANRIWTCYRRNYFQVSTAFSILGFDHSQLSEVPCLIELSDSDTDASFQRDPNSMTSSLDNLHLNERSRLAVVTNFSICITSKIASTDKKIDLIQHTPKRDKGPQIVPGLRPIRGGGTLTLAGASTNQNVVTFERVQFKTATANNGKRRAAQQFYILMVDLYAHTDDGQVFCVASSQSDSLVVRGRSPGHYIDTPERDLVTSPGLEATRERRLSSISQHSSPHPYHSHYPGPHSRSHSISAGAGISVDVSSLGLTSNGGPLSPMSPGAAGEYSPSVGAPHALYSYPTHQAWTDGSSMSSPASTYDGSAFSSPTTAYPNFQHYQGQHSPQEQAHQSYFAQRQPSFGSITPRLMMGSTGPSPGHPFDNRLEPPLEQSHESDDGSTMYYPSYENSPSGMHMKSGEYTQQQAPSSVTSPLNGHPFIKTEAQEEYFPYLAPFAHPAGHPVVEAGLAPGLGPTPSSTTASSVSSSFGYPVHEMGGMDLQQQQPALSGNGPYESTMNTHVYRPVVSIAQYPQHGMVSDQEPQPHVHQHQHQHPHQHPMAAMQHEQDRRKAMAWS